MRWQFWIDVGGTFTDCVARDPAGQLQTWKTLSSGAVKGRGDFVSASRIQTWTGDQVCQSPGFWSGWNFSLPSEPGQAAWTTLVESSNPDGLLQLRDPVPAHFTGSYELHSGEEAPLVCVRQLLNLRLADPVPAIDMRLGTTRGTNALLERKGARTALLTTQGFADLLLIGNQDRPQLFALNIVKPAPLAEYVAEVRERLAADGSIVTPLDEPAAISELRHLRQRGIESLAICTLHAWRNPVHELRLEELARQAGFTQISRSSQVSPTFKIVPRAETTVLDAYLTPVLRAYVDNIQDRLGAGSTLKLMTSHGGLVSAGEFSGKDSILSGPAGGVIAFSRVAQQAGFSKSIGFDMGGTSTDVARFDRIHDLEQESVKAGVRIALPLLAIETVAAGGGSICRFDGVRLLVGPASAGAVPGPACYGRGGPLTITDVNVFLGRILAERFPFPLDLPAITQRLEEIREQLRNLAAGVNYSLPELAQGFVDIANETMAGAIRQISVRKGYDPREHTLVCFGGAGGQHACALARNIGLPRILVHPYSGLLSAYGMGLADVRRQVMQSVVRPLSQETLDELEPRFQELERQLLDEVLGDGVPAERIEPAVRSFALRYAGTEGQLNVPYQGGAQTLLHGQLPAGQSPSSSFAISQLESSFTALHQQLYGYIREGRPLEIVSLTVFRTGLSDVPPVSQLATALSPITTGQHTQVWHLGRSVPAAVIRREDLRSGHVLTGPALLCDAGATLWIEPGFTAQVTDTGNVLLTPIVEAATAPPSEQPDNALPDPVRLEVFHKQFVSIAEQMGITLRQSSLSTNVKERLDYSCAVFDAAGGIVVNAPHIPVHLGAMGETVRCILRDNPHLALGDVYLTNDPYAGGSHLPDLTVVTPVHDEFTGQLLFLTASRAHHAEIGGITPGSMPPFSTRLGEEGILIRNFAVVRGGVSRLDELRQVLLSGPYPSRAPADNLADVTAQIAANQMGVRLLRQLIERESLNSVQLYMRHIQQAAARKMRAALSELPDGVFAFQDHLDDGSPIQAAITIAGETAVIDFAGTGPVLSTNLNGNRAIVTAAVMYVFRCLIDDDMPLNSGVLEPLTIILPECLLNPPPADDPARSPAVVGGNVETSQRVVDVLLGALGVAAASQGTMNNFSFGNDRFGYYETICGGAGATAQQAGADAVHTHMTNTRLTDVEVLEHRYPVRVEEFTIRRGSGGEGAHRGGDGIRRVIRFLEPMQVSLLTQRRGPYAPCGLQGGQPGQLGRNFHHPAADLVPIPLPGAVQLQVLAGDQVIIETPGGGGWGIG